MPLDFSPLQTIDPAGAFYRGQEAARAEQDRRMARQFQMEQGLAQRENIQAQRAEREAMARRRGQEEEEARRRRESLDKAAEMLAKAGANLDLPTLNQGLAFAMQSGNQEAAKVMSQLRSDFIAQQEYERETKRIFGGGVEPANALAASAVGGGAGPAMPTGAPPTGEAPAGAAPVNAMMAPPGVTRERVQQMMMSPSARMQAQGKALAPTLEKGPSTPDVATMQALGFPLTPQGYADYRKAQREEKAYEPSELQKTLDDLRKAPPGSPEAKALQARVQMLTTREPKEPREPREPPAPTITQIQDPTNPMQMITIDARRYAGGGVGSPGVIGASGKTVKAEAETLKKEQAQSDAAAILDTLKVAYTNLDRMRAIPSEQRGALSNIASGLAATGVGQMAGRMTGTEAQTQRDIIASARNQLFAAVKNATGLSAQNLNSNVEFTTWLNSLTDPSRSIQSNQAILENMERFIASGGKYSTRKSEGKVTSTPAAGAAGAGRYQSLSNEELLRQLGVKPGGR